MAWFIGQLVLLLVGAFLLGAVLGWVLRSWRTRAAPPPGPAAGRTAPAGETAADEQLAAVRRRCEDLEVRLATSNDLVARRDAQLAERDEALERLRGTVDRLRSASTDDVRVVHVDPSVADRSITEIRGIGPRTSSVLRAAGLGTLEAIAASEPDDLRDALDASGVRWVNDELVDAWPDEARRLMGVPRDTAELEQAET